MRSTPSSLHHRTIRRTGAGCLEPDLPGRPCVPFRVPRSSAPAIVHPCIRPGSACTGLHVDYRSSLLLRGICILARTTRGHMRKVVGVTIIAAQFAVVVVVLLGTNAPRSGLCGGRAFARSFCPTLLDRHRQHLSGAGCQVLRVTEESVYSGERLVPTREALVDVVKSLPAELVTQTDVPHEALDHAREFIRGPSGQQAVLLIE